MKRLIYFCILLTLLSAGMVGCGDDGSSGGSPKVADDPIEDMLTDQDLLAGAPQALAEKSIPEYYADPALPSDYVEAGADGLVKGLRIHKSRLVVKVNPDSTVAEINELLKTVQARAAGTAGMGLLYVELINNPTQEDLVSAINTLEASSAIDIVVEDLLTEFEEGGETTPIELLTPDSSKPVNNPKASQWTGDYWGNEGDRWWWKGEGPPAGNWWLEFIRMPAAWNFNDAIKRRAKAESLSPQELTSPIGVVDSGFQAHPDLPLSYQINRVADSHGNMVAGIIAAAHDKNSNAGAKGIEGIHPFSRISDSVLSMSMAAQLEAMIDAVLPDEADNASPTLILLISSVASHLDAYPNTKVINLSQGLSSLWKKCIAAGTCTPNDPSARPMLEKYAFLAWEAIKNHDVLIVTSAGNGSRLGGSPAWSLDAKWNGAFEYLALEGVDLGAGGVLKSDNILVVEAVGWQKYGGRRTEFSNTGGQIAAPGQCMTSTSLNKGYRSESGTSFAAPIVSGLAGYLWSIDPALTVDEVMNSILSTANWPLETANFARYEQAPIIYVDDCGVANKFITVVETPQPPIVDAFAAVMTLDRAVEMLVDADDGTLDGVTVSGTDADTLPGDSQIDMADFRAFRDALAQLDGYSNGYTLDQPFHIKRDNNRDGCVFDDDKCPVSEEVWSRFDFNGDGKLSETDTSGVWLPGDDRNLPKQQLTDLDVLASVWPPADDNWDLHCANKKNLLSEGWCAEDLPSLINSRDMIVDFSNFNPVAGEEIHIEVRVGYYYRQKIFTFDDTTESQWVFTVPFDAECAVPVPPDTYTQCRRYQTYIIAKKDNVVRAGQQNLTGSGYTAYFHSLNPGTDVMTTLYPDVVVTLDLLTGAATETQMTASASYSNALQVAYPGYKSDFFSVRNESCFSTPCVDWLDFNRTDTSLTFSFIPRIAGPHTLQFEINTGYCEEPSGICDPLPFLSGRWPMKLDFFVTDATTPEPPPPPEPPPDPPPEPPPEPAPEPEIIQATSGWSTSDSVEYTIQEVCDEATGTYTVNSSGSRHKLPSKSDPGWTEGFSESGSSSVTSCGAYQTCNNWNYWSVYMSPNIFESGHQAYYAKSCSYTSNNTGSGGSLIVERKTAVSGIRAICDDNFLKSPNLETCFDKMESSWAGWYRDRAIAYDGFYIYLMPEGILPDFPTKP